MASEYLFNSLSELTKLKKDLENGVYGGSSYGYSYECTPKSGTSFNQYNVLSFDASRSSAVYGKSSTVQPHSITCFIWRRTA